MRVLIMFVIILIFLNIGYYLNEREDPVAVSVDGDMPVISLARIIKGLNKPTHLTSPAGDDRLFIAEQGGTVRIFRGNDLLPFPFLDISRRVSCCGERGLLSLAFPPGYGQKRYFYVNYTGRNGDTVVARYRTSVDPDRADPSSEEIILTVRQPYANHNGGQLAFGPDGHLYIGMGDGGSAGDPQGNGQKAGTLLGKLLRIDVESGQRPYAVPSDNPFVKDAGYRPEIWALGLRNPWRFSFDRKTGDLYLADVGQNDYEEIDFEPAGSRGGRNYGWNVMEGMDCFREKTCDRSGLVLPVAGYGHAEGCSVTGGFVYRGSEFPELDGIYFYGDYCSGRIWGLKKKGDSWEKSFLIHSEYSFSTFGEDGRGEIYAADYRGGEIYRIMPRNPVSH